MLKCPFAFVVLAIWNSQLLQVRLGQAVRKQAEHSMWQHVHMQQDVVSMPRSLQHMLHLPAGTTLYEARLAGSRLVLHVLFAAPVWVLQGSSESRNKHAPRHAKSQTFLTKPSTPNIHIIPRVLNNFRRARERSMPAPPRVQPSRLKYGSKISFLGI